MSAEKFYITTAISYVNDVPHLGHVFEAVGTDVQARYQRMLGKDVFFLTGTDEHGQKNAAVALAKGIAPQEHVDTIAAEFKRVWDLLEISYTEFIRTTDPRHHEAAAQLWKRALANGDIYLGKYEGWYDVKEESFITETELKARGIEPDGKNIRRMSEDAYFFRLEKYRLKVREYVEANPGFVQPESRRNEVLGSFLANELPDLCVSRTSLTWGIPVPDAPGHVMYVWFDALTNYITGIGFGDPAREADWKKWWPCDVHVLGKDILKFHAVIWPAMLFSAGIEPPKAVFGHGFINVMRKDAAEVEKMSKSAGNAINPLDYISTVGVEPLRYFLMREINYGNDGLFNEGSLKERYTADLANTLGNLLSRTTGMVERYLEGNARRTRPEEWTDAERAIVTLFNETVTEYERAMPAFEYHVALAKVWEFLTLLNKSITDVKPWDLAKDMAANGERLRVFLCVIIEGLAATASFIEPFMPQTSLRMRESLGAAQGPPAWKDAREWGGCFDTLNMKKSEPLFPRFEEKPT